MACYEIFKSRKELFDDDIVAGELFLHRGKFAEAEEYFKRFLDEEDSFNIEAQYGLLCCLVNKGEDDEEVKSLVDMILLVEPNHFGALVQKGDFDGALKCRPYDTKILFEKGCSLDEILVLNPYNVYFLKQKALFCLRDNDLDQYITCCERILALEPDIEENKNALLAALQNRITEHLSDNAFDNALVLYDKILTLKPGDIEVQQEKDKVLCQKAGDLFEDGDISEAIAIYEDVLSHSSECILAKAMLVNTLVYQGEMVFRAESYDEALKIFERALALDPERDEIKNCCVKVLVAQSKVLEEGNFFDQMLERYDRILELFPENEDVLIAKCNIWVTKGRKMLFNRVVSDENFRASLPCFEQALNFDSNNFSALQSMGVVFLMLKDYERADCCFVRALEQKTEDVDCLGGRALVSLFRKEYHHASCSIY